MRNLYGKESPWGIVSQQMRTLYYCRREYIMIGPIGPENGLNFSVRPQKKGVIPCKYVGN